METTASHLEPTPLIYGYDLYKMELTPLCYGHDLYKMELTASLLRTWFR